MNRVVVKDVLETMQILLSSLKKERRGHDVGLLLVVGQFPSHTAFSSLTRHSFQKCEGPTSKIIHIFYPQCLCDFNQPNNGVSSSIRRFWCFVSQSKG